MTHKIAPVVAATLKRLSSFSSPNTPLRSLRGIVLGKDVQEPTDQLSFLNGLVSAANTAADSLSCASILAGHTSEGDDFGDVPVWLGLGAYGVGNERAVLTTLGLGLETGEVSHVALSAKRIPATVTVPKSPTSEQASALDNWAKQFAHLEDLHCFSTPASGSQVLYSLIGRNASGWGGLVGIGIQADFD